MSILKAVGFDPAKNSVKTEIIAGLTTFFTMAYILAIIPTMFSPLEPQGMNIDAVFTSTALASIIATLCMAFLARKPFVLAPGMGLIAFFVYTVCIRMGHTWQFAVTAVLFEGVLFAILTLSKLRDMILNAIPLSLKNAIAAGIGLFIAFIGLQNAGLVVADESTLVGLGDLTSGTGLLAVLGLVISGSLVMLHIRGGILWGIIITSILGLFIKDPVTMQPLTQFGGVFAMPPSVAPNFCRFDWAEVCSWDMLAAVFTFLFVGLFNTMGTVIGVSQKAGFVKPDGSIPDSKRIFMCDAVGAMVSACLGNSCTTTYVESSAGVGAGGRTGLTALTAAVCFSLALFLSPLFLSIPAAATAPSLIIVGMMMMQPIVNVNWLDYRESLPAFLTVILMPMAYSISDGIFIGTVAYVVLFALSGKWRKISPMMWVLGVLFVLKYVFIK